MALFSYTARDEKGTLVQGTIDAVSLQAARISLQEMHLQPEEVHESTLSEQSLTQSDEQEYEPESQWRTIPDKIEEQQEPLPPSHNEHPAPAMPAAAPSNRIYFPIVDTLRLYAGWLLTGYFLAYALGSYKLLKPIPFDIPFALAFLYSPLILSFTFAAFLFLLFTGLYKKTKGGMLRGFLLLIIAVMLYLFFLLNS